MDQLESGASAARAVEQTGARAGQVRAIAAPRCPVGPAPCPTAAREPLLAGVACPCVARPCPAPWAGQEAFLDVAVCLCHFALSSMNSQTPSMNAFALNGTKNFSCAAEAQLSVMHIPTSPCDDEGRGGGGGRGFGPGPGFDDMGLPPLDPMAGPAMPLGQVSTFFFLLKFMHADVCLAGILTCANGKTEHMGFASYESAESEMAGLTRSGVMQSAELASMQRMQRQLAAQQAAMQQQLREAQAAAQAAQRAVAQVRPDLLLLCARCVANHLLIE